MRKITFIVLCIFVSLCLFAEERDDTKKNEKPTVVVVPFDVKEVPADEAEVLFEVFQSEFANIGVAKVVDRSSLDKIKKQQEFQNSDWSNADKVAELGKALNASMVVTGQIMVFKQKYIVTVKLIDVNTTEIVSSVVERVTDTSELLDKLPEMAKKLGDRISGQANSEASQKKSKNDTALAAASTTTTTIPVKIVYKDRVEYKDKIVYRDKIEYRDRPAKNSIKYPGGFAALLSLGITCFVSSAIFMIASGAYDAYYLYDIFDNSNRVGDVWTYRIESSTGEKTGYPSDSYDLFDSLYKYRWPAFLGIGLGGGLPFFVAGIIFTACTAATIERNKLAVDHNRPISRKKRTIAFLKRTAIDGGYNFVSDEVTVGMTVKI